jgi:spermidine synthase
MEKSQDDIEPHVPRALELQEKYGVTEEDARHFETHLPKLAHYEEELAKAREGINNDYLFFHAFHGREGRVLRGMVEATGEVPTPAELSREKHRQQELLDRQQLQDAFIDPRAFRAAEEDPQKAVIKSREKDFPSDPSEWETAPAEIRTVPVKTRNGVQDETQLIITTSTQDEGRTFDHPVMTTAEIEWVEDSADVIAKHAGKDGKVFIGGLGLGLLNEALHKRGVGKQVVGEINKNVIKKVEPGLKEKMGDKLEVRQGDFKETLRQAVANGEQFDAISIDAFPNSADEVNKDASNKEVLELALSALKPGGLLTFYPDSRYIPSRVLKTLSEAGIPNSCIHYGVSEFKQSDFTKEYHYGDLMAVPQVLKPVTVDYNTIKSLMDSYYQGEQAQLDSYSSQYIQKRAA